MPVGFHGIVNQAVCMLAVQSSAITFYLLCLKQASCLHQMSERLLKLMPLCEGDLDVSVLLQTQSA